MRPAGSEKVRPGNARLLWNVQAAQKQSGKSSSWLRDYVESWQNMPVSPICRVHTAGKN